MTETTRYSIVGLGKLGCSMAAGIARRGFQVIGLDVLPETVRAVSEGRAPVTETNLEATLTANRARIRATDDYREAILESDVTFVIVPTPSDAQGAFSLRHAVSAFRQIGQALREKDSYHLVVLTSTVLPGSTRYGLIPELERTSGKRCGTDFGVCYSPEFIALGSIIHDFLNPDFTLVGEVDSRAGDLLQECYARLMENRPPCKRMSLENAELAKIAVNTFVTTKITFANMIAELCEQLPGGDVDVVCDALGADQRIGPRYLRGALGYGGPCFPRDNIALGVMARYLGESALLAETTDLLNRRHVGRIVDRVRCRLEPGRRVAVLGLAYKPDTHVVEASQGTALAAAFAEAGYVVTAFDPLAGDEARRELGDKVCVTTDMRACIEGAHCVVITLPDPAYATLTAAELRQGEGPVLVFDCWRVLRRELEGVEGIHYVPLGLSLDDRALGDRLADIWGQTAGTDGV